MEKMRIAIYCELNELNSSFEEESYELISKMFQLKKQAFLLLGKEIDYKIDSICLGDKIDELSIKKAYKAGSDRVVLIKNELYRSFLNTTFQKALIEYFDTVESYDIILFPASLKSRMLAPKVTTALNAGLVADCIDLDFILKNEKLYLASTRPTFGSELMATIVSKTKPECATIRKKSFPPVFENDKDGEFVEFEGNPYIENRLKILQTLFDKNSKGENNLENSKIILCAGFGLCSKNQEYFEKLKVLAEKIGANVASTRKVVDFNLMEKETQIGQTGTSVCPKLYIGFGVSGAIQHICGMKHSSKIAAINIDENAEIFKYCDYKIVEDAKKIIDEMLNKLER